MVALTVAVALWFPASAGAAEEDLVIVGSGWGHGIGFSQYGARAMADSGLDSSEILAHYFPGTSLRHLDTMSMGLGLFTAAPLWIGLLQDQPEIAFHIEVGDANLCFDDSELCIAHGAVGQKWKFGPDGLGQCKFSRKTGDGGYVAFEPSGSCSGSVQMASPDGIFYVPLKGRSYRNGTLRIRESPLSGRLHLSVQLEIEDYVRGVQELPDFWPGSSLEAQAVVSRTLAARPLVEYGGADDFDIWRQGLCACHVKDDDSEQAFGGYTAELGRPFWQGRVGATAGTVLTYNNDVISARFTSSTGGRTESNTAAGGEYRPYLISVDDQLSLSTAAANPFVSWVERFARNKLGSVFGFLSLTEVRILERNDSGSVKSVALSGVISGRPGTLVTSGKSIRAALDLHSSYFDIVLFQRFVDVRPSDTFAGEILGLSELGITAGCTETMFCPNDPVTREQMAAFLVRNLGLNATEGTDPFTDDDGSLFETEIETLYHHGITAGCTETMFCPTDPVTREQMAAFLNRAYLLVGATEGTNSFTDDDGSLFETEIETLYHHGITAGCTETMFCPTDPVTREQMAAFLIRARSFLQ